MKTNGNFIWCERHKGWFYSHVWAREGRRPKQCPTCKRLDWEVVKK